MDNYLKVKGHEGLYRDPSTGAIINNDIPTPRKFSYQFNTAIEDINNLKEEISEIKSLLRELIRNASNT
jgi:hypothetical protein